MKNRKRFQQFMFSAIALSALIPFASHPNVVQARYKGNHANEINLLDSYGVAPNLQGDNKGKGGTKGGIGIYQKSNPKNANGTLNANYVHDTLQTGILIKNKNIKGQAFGPTKSRFMMSKEGGNEDWVVYTYGKKQSEKGKVGVFYENALTYWPTHDKRYKKGQKIQLDARLIWNGSQHYEGTPNNANIQFNTKDLAVQEPYKAAANVTLQLYNHKTGKPFYTRSLIKQTDIDYTQGLIFNDPSYILFSETDNTRLNTGTREKWNTNVAGKSKIFGDNDKWYSGTGTVTASMKEGAFSYLPKKQQSSFNVTFVHQYKAVPWGYSQSYFATPAKSFHKPYSSIHRGAAHYDEGKNYKYTDANGKVHKHHADYFGFEFDKQTTTSYKITADKQVSTKPNHFKKADKKSNAFEVKNTQPLYFDIHTQLKEASMAMVPDNNTKSNYYALPIKTVIKDADDPNASAIKSYIGSKKKNTQALVLRDYIDSRFTVEDAKVVYSKKWNDTHLTGLSASADKYFKVYPPKPATGKHKGQTIVDAVLRPSAMKAKSTAWMKDYHLIIKVKLKDNIMPEVE